MKVVTIIPTLFADWANGIFAVVVVGWLFGVDPLWWHFLIGVLLSHSPDIDALPEIWRNGKVGADAEHPEDHRTLLHYPIPVLSLLLLILPFDPYWGGIWFVAVLLHYVNDFYGTGWGVRLLWPFSAKNYKLLGRRANRLRSILQRDGDWDSLSHSERRLRLIVSWTPEELPRYLLRWGLRNWEKEYYWRLNWIMGIEYALFVLAIGLLIGTLV